MRFGEEQQISALHYLPVTSRANVAIDIERRLGRHPMHRLAHASAGSRVAQPIASPDHATAPRNLLRSHRFHDGPRTVKPEAFHPAVLSDVARAHSSTSANGTDIGPRRMASMPRARQVYTGGFAAAAKRACENRPRMYNSAGLQQDRCSKTALNSSRHRDATGNRNETAQPSIPHRQTACRATDKPATNGARSFRPSDGEFPATCLFWSPNPRQAKARVQNTQETEP